MDLSRAETPSLILDRSRLERNCALMLDRCRRLGVKLRPHMKTLKSIDAARIAIDPDFGAIAVSTLREAEYFAQAGIDDIQYAVCITPDKLPRAVSISRSIPRFSFFLDSVAMARAVADCATETGTALRTWIEIESGGRRTGIDPDSLQLIEIAQTLSASPAVLEGVATHGGHAYGARDSASIAAIAEQERSAIVFAADRLRTDGFEVPGVSAGSTPTAVQARSGEGLSEIRAGVYMAGDLFQAAIGSLPQDDIAVSVLASVLSHQPERNQIVIDAGGLALSKDRSTAALEDGDRGFGTVVDIEGKDSLGPLIVRDVHQEHGEVSGPDPIPFDRLPIGARVRVIPNHVCMTAGAYDRFLVVDGGTEVHETWDKVVGW
jgi:D-serine deaminase-like pyridoxal phosphate-dependent protein